MFRRKRQAAVPAGPQYLTVGGATVDLHTISAPDAKLAEINAVCNGCGDSKCVSSITAHDSDAAANLRRAVTRAGKWAQDHASTCRAVPKVSR